jgi:hypothetical protein
MGICSWSLPYQLSYSCTVSYKSESRYDRRCQSVRPSWCWAPDTCHWMLLYCPGAPPSDESACLFVARSCHPVHTVCPASCFCIFREWRWLTREANHSPWCRPEGMQLITVVLLYGVVPPSFFCLNLPCANPCIFVITGLCFSTFFSWLTTVTKRKLTRTNRYWKY